MMELDAVFAQAIEQRLATPEGRRHLQEDAASFLAHHISAGTRPSTRTADGVARVFEATYPDNRNSVFAVFYRLWVYRFATTAQKERLHRFLKEDEMHQMEQKAGVA